MRFTSPAPVAPSLWSGFWISNLNGTAQSKITDELGCKNVFAKKFAVTWFRHLLDTVFISIFFQFPGDVTWFNMKLLEQAIYYKSIKPCEETLKCRTNFSKPFFITRLWRFQIWHLHSHKLNEQREGNWGSNMKTIDSIATVDKRCALHFIFNRCLPSSCEVAMQNPQLQPLVMWRISHGADEFEQVIHKNSK